MVFIKVMSSKTGAASLQDLLHPRGAHAPSLRGALYLSQCSLDSFKELYAIDMMFIIPIIFIAILSLLLLSYVYLLLLLL